MYFSESTGSIQLKRTMTGPLSIRSVRGDGGLICIENTSASKEMDISSWRLTRKSGRNLTKEAVFTIPRNTVIEAKALLNVYASDYRDEAGRRDLVADKCQNFGFGDGSCVLADQNLQMKATCDVTFRN